MCVGVIMCLVRFILRRIGETGVFLQFIFCDDQTVYPSNQLIEVVVESHCSRQRSESLEASFPLGCKVS